MSIGWSMCGFTGAAAMVRGERRMWRTWDRSFGASAPLAEAAASLYREAA